MKKIIIVVFAIAILLVGCGNKVDRKAPEYEHINATVQSCIQIEGEDRYEVELLLENGETFAFSTTENLNEPHDVMNINMGYDFERKVTDIAVISENK